MTLGKEIFKPKKIGNIRFDNQYIIITIDGKEYKINLTKVSAILLNASDTARNDYEISPAGYGIHWKQLDEDLSIQGLLREAEKQGN